MHEIDIAILKTIIYADVFHFPMTAQEIHHFLIHDKSIEFDVIQEQLESSKLLTDHLYTDGTYIALKQRRDILPLRHEREQVMLSLSHRVTYFGRILSYFPFVELVGVTGALAMRNPSSDNDDLDYLIVTRPGRVWLARAAIIFLVRLMRFRNIEICPNYVLASDKLVQSRQDLYIAHEIAQIIPLSNQDLYQQLRDHNLWTFDQLPNAKHALHELANLKQNKLGLAVKRVVERILLTPFGNWLEKWEYNRKAVRFQSQAEHPTAAAEIDESHVKGHFNDYGHRVLAQYQAKLEELDIKSYEYPLQSVGD